MPDSRAGQILKGTGLAIAGTLFGLLLAAAIVSALSVTFFNYEIIVVKSGSMEPTYRKGDVVVVRPERMDKVKEGDVILFNEKNTGVPFVHRVIAMRIEVLRLVQRGTGELLGEEHKYYFRTQGDANRTPDGAEVSADEYVGKVWFDVPTFGLLASGVSPTTVLFGLSGAIGVAWIAYEVVRRRRGPGTPATPRRRRGGRPLPTPAGQDGPPQSAIVLRPALPRRLGLGRRARWLGGHAAAALSAIRGDVGRRRSRATGWLAHAPHGSGLLVALPAALWVAALAIVFSVGARAQVVKWVDSGWTGGQAQVYVPQPSPSPSPTENAAASPSPSPSPSPEATATPTPSPSPSPSPTPTDAPTGSCDDAGDATPTPGAEDPCATPSEDATPTPTPTDDPTEDPTDEATPTPTDDPAETPTEESTSTPADTPTDDPTEEATPTPTTDPTEQPTATATETTTPDPTETP